MLPKMDYDALCKCGHKRGHHCPVIGRGVIAAKGNHQGCHGGDNFDGKPKCKCKGFGLGNSRRKDSNGRVSPAALKRSKMHKYQKQAAENIPDGYSRVRSGRILPDDLVWSLFTKEFLRHDDPSWHHRCDWVNQAAFVVRASDKKKPETDNGPEQLLIYAPQQTFGF